MIKKIALDKLEGWPRNYRRHPAEQVRRLVDSLERNGQRKAVVVQKKTNRIIAGHGVVEAARSLGWKEVRCDVWDVTDQQAEAFLVDDNELVRFAEDDEEVLAALLSDLVDSDYPALSYDPVDIEAMLGAQSDLEDPGAGEPPEEPTTKLGDLWQCGEHRVLCGDCTVADDVAMVMAGQKATHVFTDPPYRFEPLGGRFCAPHDKGGRSLRRTLDSIEEGGLADFDPGAFLVLLPSFFDQGTISAFVFCSKDLLPDYLNWAVDNGISFNVLVWWKTGGVVPFGTGPIPDLEYLMLLRKSAKWVTGTDANRSKVLQYGREHADVGDHPTPKPLELVANQLRLTTDKGDIVADPFLGSGTTMIAAEKLGRRCYGIEIEPRYVDVSIRRWEEMTGEKAVLL